jgi:hypothetical protein
MDLRRIYPGTLMLLVVFFVGVLATVASPPEGAVSRPNQSTVISTFH